MDGASANRAATFRRRLISTLVLWVVVAGALFAPDRSLAHGAFLLAMVAITLVALRETNALLARNQLSGAGGLSLAFGGIYTVWLFIYLRGVWFDPSTTPQPIASHWDSLFISGFVLCLLFWQLKTRDLTGAARAIAGGMLAWIYIPWLLGFIQKIYFFPGLNGPFFLFYFILVTKFSDLGAYTIGSLFGRHKMVPRISPGKTWEGFAGALIVATGASLVVRWMAPGSLGMISFGAAGGLGLVLSALAVVGDLVESILKRGAGIKDSGALFPGIGGMLDLMDSLLFNAPVMFGFLLWITR